MVFRSPTLVLDLDGNLEPKLAERQHFRDGSFMISYHAAEDAGTGSI